MGDKVQALVTEGMLLAGGIFLVAKGERETGLTLLGVALGGGGAKLALPSFQGRSQPPAPALPPAPGAPTGPSAPPPVVTP